MYASDDTGPKALIPQVYLINAKSRNMKDMVPKKRCWRASGPETLRFNLEQRAPLEVVSSVASLPVNVCSRPHQMPNPPPSICCIPDTH